MPSDISKSIRQTLEKDSLRPGVPIEQKRKEWEDAVRELPLPAGVSEKQATVAGVPCLWLIPEITRWDQTILYLHGGGLVEGSATMTREFASRLALTLNRSILIVDYRLAPEFPFPAALEDTKAVYRALLEAGSSANQIIVGGDSNGGGLALAALIALRDSEVALPAGLFLISPVVDLTFSGETIQSRAEIDPFTSEEVLRHCADLYAAGADLSQPLISPLFANLSGLPPMLIQVGKHEILLSDSTRLATMAFLSGTQAELKMWDEMWHVWHYFAELPEAQEALDQIRQFIDQL